MLLKNRLAVSLHTRIQIDCDLKTQANTGNIAALGLKPLGE